jgi:hypothetical protein
MKTAASRALVIASMLAAVVSAAGAQPAPSRPADGWVVLSIDEYRALRDKAFPPARPTPPPAVAASVGRIDYELSVDGQAATGQVRVTADVFKDDWVFVPIPPGLRVKQATLDGKAVAIVNERDKDRAPSILIARAGRHVVQLDVGMPVASKSGTESLAFPVSPAPVQRVSVSIRGADAALTASGGLVEQRVPAAATTKFLVCGRANEPLLLSWGRRVPIAPASRPSRFRGSVTALVGLAEDSAQVSAQVRLNVLDGIVERAALRLPSAFVVGQVTGPLVGDWEQRSDGTLAVTLVEPSDHDTEFTVTGEARTARDGRIAVPLVRLAGAEVESGGVAVEVLGAGEITAHAGRGLDAADAADLSEFIAARRSPALVAFRYKAQAPAAERALEVTVARYTPQAVLLANVDEARYRALVGEDGKALVEARLAVRNSQRSFLGVTLPADAVVWTAFVDDRPVRPGRTADGALLLPILRDRGRPSGGSVVRLTYLTRSAPWPEQGPATLDLPALDLPSSRTGLVVHLPPRFKVTVEAGPLREQPYEEPASELLRADRAPRPAPAPPAAARADKAKDDLASLYQRAAGGRVTTGALPVDIPFPEFGPLRFLAAELTSEGKTLQVRFTVKRQVK